MPRLNSETNLQDQAKREETEAPRSGVSEKTLRIGRRRQKRRPFYCALLWLVLLLIPLGRAFLGQELQFTGYAIFRYENFLTHPELVDYAEALPLLIGNLWARLFQEGGPFGALGLGILAFNLLEVLLEWGIALVSYRLLKKPLGRITTLLGLIGAQLMMSTYYNVFNTKSLTVFLLLLLTLFQMRALEAMDPWPRRAAKSSEDDGEREERRKRRERRRQRKQRERTPAQDFRKVRRRRRRALRFSFAAGITFALLVINNPWNFLALIFPLIYFIEAWLSTFPDSQIERVPLFRHAVSWLLGAAVGFACFYGLLYGLGSLHGLDLLGRYREDLRHGLWVIREYLKPQGKELIKANLWAFASGMIFLMAGVIFLLSMGHTLRVRSRKVHRTFVILTGLVCIAIALSLMIYSWNITDEGPRLGKTLGHRFVLGVLYANAFFLYLACVFRSGPKARRMRILLVSGIFIPFLLIWGGATSSKDSLLGYWLLFPQGVYTIRQLLHSDALRVQFEGITLRWRLRLPKLAMRSTAWVLAIFFLIKFATIVPYTYAFNKVNPLRFRWQVEEPKLRGIHVDYDQKESLEEMLRAIEEADPTGERPLHVYGSSVLYHYLTGREPYALPWVTRPQVSRWDYWKSLSDARLRYGNEGLPVVLYCRTNSIDGFDPERAELLRGFERLENHRGKKYEFFSWLRFYNYGVVMENPHYLVLMPQSDMDPRVVEELIWR